MKNWNETVEETISYYDANTADFIESTVDVDFEENHTRFLRYLTEGASILDFGCGSGRDTKYFISKGYAVEAIDGSEEMCRAASAYAKIPVKHMLFSELKEIRKYDGIWACASILHLCHVESVSVLLLLARALKMEGVLYVSFKYGTFEGMRNGRYFKDMTEERFMELIDGFAAFELEELWITPDVRPGRDEPWLNAILRKVED